MCDEKQSIAPAPVLNSEDEPVRQNYISKTSLLPARDCSVLKLVHKDNPTPDTSRSDSAATVPQVLKPISQERSEV